ncbi:MAG TPA: GUN4 domain-containing protein [Trichormus sp. M33_DOE_039]|nr:GUN4 domain-containing protein [Trichormus sp. M33_DOE_039]
MQLGLRDEDATQIEESILAPIEETESLKLQQQEAERIRKQQETESLKRRQELETERLRIKREQEEAERRLQETDDLSSEKGVDYRRLRDLLKAGQWKEADQETLQVMLKAADREKEGWLEGTSSIEKFPCTDLRTIDQLWVRYSNGRYGFSVQKKIWIEVGKDWNAFYTSVGWQKFGWMFFSWVKEDSVKYDGTGVPGHLPTPPIGIAWNRSGGICNKSLFSRVETCKI